MKSIGLKLITVFSFLILIGLSTPAHSETNGEQQAELGKAIQQAAVLKQEGANVGGAQEMLGRAIQQASQSAQLQEQLGKQIQEAAALQYAEGRAQENIAGTLLHMARS